MANDINDEGQNITSHYLWWRAQLYQERERAMAYQFANAYGESAQKAALEYIQENINLIEKRLEKMQKTLTTLYR